MRYLYFLFFILLFSCQDENLIYCRSKVIKNNIWAHNDTLNFDVDIKDSTLIFDVNINVRNDNSYPYNNLGLLFLINKSDSLIYNDTLNLTVSCEEEGWIGNGWGSLFEFKTNVITDFNLQDTGVYNFMILQYMKDNELKGINSVGLELEIVDYSF